MELHFQYWKSEAGSGSPRIVLLHGMGGTGALWRPLAATLENEFEILAPDQRGHGKSLIEGGNFTPLDYGQDVVDTMKARDFHPSWILGHSMGVRTACATAHLKPEWVKGLVLIDLGFFGPAGGGLGETLEKFLHVLPESFPSREKARAFMSGKCPDPSIAQYLMAVSVLTSTGEVIFPFSKQALIKTIQAAEHFSIREWIREAAERGIRVLALRGAKSLVWGKMEFDEEKTRFRDLPNVAFEEVADAGHGLPFEQRTVLANRIKQLARVGRGT